MSDEAEGTDKPADAERDALHQVVTVLRQRFPHLDDATVTGCVTDAHRGFAAAPIRDFVPLLVEREAVRGLSVLVDRRPGDTAPG